MLCELQGSIVPVLQLCIWLHLAERSDTT